MAGHFKQAHSGNYKAGRTNPITYLVIHYTGNDGDTAANNVSYFAGGKVGVSAHYFVDAKEVWQSVADIDTAWHCGTTGTYYHPACRNANSIGIELCAYIDKGGSFCFLSETISNAVWLTRHLMDEYNIPVSNVVRHYDVTHKLCPRPYVENEKAWQAFLNALTTPDKQEDEDMQVIYKTLADVPDWAQETVQKLIAKGYLNGEAEGILNLEHHALRNLVINDRAGVYK